MLKNEIVHKISVVKFEVAQVLRKIHVDEVEKPLCPQEPAESQ